MAEKYLKVLLAVFYCNSKDKTLAICDWCKHEDCDQRKVVDWSFTKNMYKWYQNVLNPGKIKELELRDLCPKTFSDTFYNAPVWEQVAIDKMTIPLIDLWNNEVTQFADVPFKCVRLAVFDNESVLQARESKLPSGPWTYFANCEKVEIFFEDINTRAYKNILHNVLKCVKHPNLHVVLGCPIRVSDANPNSRQAREWYGKKIWKLFDVENFVNRIAVMSIKSLTYTLPEIENKIPKPPTVTFNCDEGFPFSFMTFLETQRIYCG